ncbi:Hsp20/alpha crystallin family protein [Pedobacter sp.]|uniref:Hsp20/alpha crystallin family protein n=1 Tax=Pedobacter sp. TaxID=1411316 RepID=UPI003D7F402B
MKSLVKSNGFPSFRSMVADLWNRDDFFTKPLLEGEILPAVNIRDKKDAYELEVSAPGFKKDDFKVTTENGMLTISAETSSENLDENDDYTRKEFSRSSFSRTFSLPENIMEDNIKASYQDGLLKIALKKSEDKKIEAKQVPID